MGESERIVFASDPIHANFKERYMSCSERKRELRRRRHRKKKVTAFARKLPKATVSERAVMADKLRNLTPGAETVIASWELEKR